MVYNVSRAAIEACTECPRDHACLHEDGDKLCRISGCVDGAVYFITCADENPCPYKRPAWGRVYCNCPIRREIYHKYDV